MQKRQKIVLAVVLLCLSGNAWSGNAWADGDVDAGKVVFNKCGICHSPNAGVNKVGPSLHGIVGRHSASLDSYNYSAAMKATGWDWSEAKLDTYLTDPRGVVPGTKMIFPGLKSITDRADVIAYLKTLG